MTVFLGLSTAVQPAAELTMVFIGGAGVPGMVGAMLRHLRSLRSFKRDHGWIHTLLEEAENERMHLLTFLSLKQPNFLFRAAVLGAQGVCLWAVGLFVSQAYLCYHCQAVDPSQSLPCSQ